MATRRELLEAIQRRYQEATLAAKTAILNEFVEVTGYHRKHCVRLLGPSAGRQQQKKPRAKGRIYDDAVQEVLILVWEASDRICGKRLKAIVPLLLELMKKHGHLQLDRRARVSKRYHAPMTPYDRVIASPQVPKLQKQELQAIFAQLDPIDLIRNIRGVQEELAIVKTNELEQLKSESAESFVRKLRTVWHQGEVRPTHRRQAARHWRTRPDPFETVRSRIQEQLSLTPDMGAKKLFQQLGKEYPGQFAENQIRTLRRRVREWRMDLAKRLILSASGSEAQSGLISLAHIEAAQQRKETDLEMGSAQSRDLTLPGQNAFRGR